MEFFLRDPWSLLGPCDAMGSLRPSEDHFGPSRSTGEFWISGPLAEVEIPLGLLEAPLGLVETPMGPLGTPVCPLGAFWMSEPLVEWEVPFGSVGVFWTFELLAESEICLGPLEQFFACPTSSGLSPRRISARFFSTSAGTVRPSPRLLLMLVVMCVLMSVSLPARCLSGS